MKNFLLSLIAIFILSVSVSARLNNDDNRYINEKLAANVKNKVTKEPIVDSFEVVEDAEEANGSNNSADAIKPCRITVNYYYEGHFVAQQTYTGNTCPLYGQTTCREWKADVMKMIWGHIREHETMMPTGGLTC
ncbi:hypothetical protein [Chryseobacterium binzhouense]|uniref:hypothetical protein n=1 Tax=Chryseobacterium binzhouense TaxID=2593646 RepID=UPI0011816EAB|nr:hypothetical protein [Chryseobacterium binzhouense]